MKRRWPISRRGEVRRAQHMSSRWSIGGGSGPGQGGGPGKCARGHHGRAELGPFRTVADVKLFHQLEPALFTSDNSQNRLGSGSTSAWTTVYGRLRLQIMEAMDARSA